MKPEFTSTQTAAGLRIPFLEDEVWWGGAVADGMLMPFDGRTPMSRDLATNSGLLDKPETGCNQSAPLLISSRGRVVSSAAPFTFTIADRVLVIDGPAELGQADSADLRSAMLLAASSAFTPTGTAPARELFEAPSYNVWMELPFKPTQAGVIAYARRILDAGLPAGVLMIDDNWSGSYGEWTFDPARFPDPAQMVTELAEMGFPVMLWVAPYVTPDTAVFRSMRDADLLLRDADGKLVVREWWNGYGAIMDVTNPATVQWILERLKGLCDDLGIAGFKFDGGDLRDYRAGDGGVEDAAVRQCHAWSQIGREFAFNEFRSSWATSGWPLMQRLTDKPAIPFAPGGLDSLIPEGIAQGLMGYPFVCPDLIGGGEISTAAVLGDEEFIVRYTQCAALFPLMQFSANPARVLGAEALAAVRAAIGIRAELLPELMALIEHAAQTGEPILRPLAYHHPGTEHIHDQFLLGDSILVAPVLQRGVTEREVVIPEGVWRDELGAEVTGPTTITRSVDLATLPRYRRVNEATAAS